MSTRTIIEINHDDLNELYENTATFKNVLMHLRAADLQKARREGEPSGLRILGQRHHNEPEFAQCSRVILPSFDEARNYITNHTGYPPDARVMYDYLRTKVLVDDQERKP